MGGNEGEPSIVESLRKALREIFSLADGKELRGHPDTHLEDFIEAVVERGCYKRDKKGKATLNIWFDGQPRRSIVQVLNEPKYVIADYNMFVADGRLPEMRGRGSKGRTKSSGDNSDNSDIDTTMVVPSKKKISARPIKRDRSPERVHDLGDDGELIEERAQQALKPRGSNKRPRPSDPLPPLIKRARMLIADDLTAMNNTLESLYGRALDDLDGGPFDMCQMGDILRALPLPDDLAGKAGRAGIHKHQCRLVAALQRVEKRIMEAQEELLNTTDAKSRRNVQLVIDMIYTQANRMVRVFAKNPRRFVTKISVEEIDSHCVVFIRAINDAMSMVA
jgi:hypothetical protein